MKTFKQIDDIEISIKIGFYSNEPIQEIGKR